MRGMGKGNGKGLQINGTDKQGNFVHILKRKIQPFSLGTRHTNLMTSSVIMASDLPKLYCMERQMSHK